MSSTYGALCLSHDPAIEAGDQTECYQREPKVSAARLGKIEGHAGCDVLIARYSYPIVEVYCPGTAGRGDPGGRGCGRTFGHPHAVWIDPDWLRLLVYAYRDGTGVPAELLGEFARGCWTRTRVLRLAPLLGIDLGVSEPADAVPDGVGGAAAVG